MRKLTVLKNDLLENLNDISKDFCNDYGLAYSSYIGDLITEHADQNVDIYNSDRAKWFADNWELVDEAIAEFGKSDNIMQDIAAAQFLQNDRQLYEDLEQIILILALDFLLEHGFFEVEDFKIEKLFNDLKEIDHNSKTDQIIEIIYNNIDF